MCPFGSPPVNAAGETPLDVARRFKNAECKDLVGGGKGALDLRWENCAFQIMSLHNDHPS